MSRHTPRSMLGLAMLLVGTGAECASAAPRPKGDPQDDNKSERGDSNHVGGNMAYDGSALRMDMVRAAYDGFEPYEPPPVNRQAKPRSKSGQRRAHARGRQ